MKRRKMRNRFVIAVIVTLVCSFMGGCAKTEPVGIDKAYINDGGELVLSYTDGTEQNLGVVVGNDGRDGVDGVNGMDGKDGVDGKDGNDGKDGADGKDGMDGADGQDGSITVVNKGSNIAYATSKGLQSAVSIVCNFTPKQSGWYTGKVKQDYTASGSGVIYRLDKEKGDAFIITNHHVVYDADCDSSNGISRDIEVYLYGSEMEEQKMAAEYVGGSAYYDIAVLHIKNSDLLKKSAAKAVTVTDSDKVVVGEAAIAIGNAKGGGTSASYGVVSVDSEHISLSDSATGQSQSFRVIRVDTPVNPGNSGGGLYNESGELMGIVNAKIIDSTVENIAYAIPSKVATFVADNLIDHCYGTSCESVQRGMLGVTVQTVESHMQTEPDTGHVHLYETVKVVEVSGNSLVKGQIQAGDILKSISFEDETGVVTLEITRQYHIVDAMLKAREGDEITVGVLREGKEVYAKVVMTKEHISEY